MDDRSFTRSGYGKEFTGIASAFRLGVARARFNKAGGFHTREGRIERSQGHFRVGAGFVFVTDIPTRALAVRKDVQDHCFTIRW